MRDSAVVLSAETDSRLRSFTAKELNPDAVRLDALRAAKALTHEIADLAPGPRERLH
jgi:hypothetical protein